MTIRQAAISVNRTAAFGGCLNVAPDLCVGRPTLLMDLTTAEATVRPILACFGTTPGTDAGRYKECGQLSAFEGDVITFLAW